MTVLPSLASRVRSLCQNESCFTIGLTLTLNPPHALIVSALAVSARGDANRNEMFPQAVGFAGVSRQGKQCRDEQVRVVIGGALRADEPGIDDLDPQFLHEPGTQCRWIASILTVDENEVEELVIAGASR